MRIARDGTWFYMGTPFTRQRMVRLFSRVLKREGDNYFLVTPVEKVQIQVDDVPFTVIDLEHVDSNHETWLQATTNVGDTIIVDDEHRLWVEEDEHGQPAPYIHVRKGLNARLTRSVFYRLIEQAQERVDGDRRAFIVKSGHHEFSLGEVMADDE